jgi:hypothetical protein
MFKFKIPIEDEDKFMVLLQLVRSRIDTRHFDVAALEIESDKENLCFLVEYKHPKVINNLLAHFKDFGTIVGCRISYAFVYSKEEAYTDKDGMSIYSIIYNKLC